MNPITVTDADGRTYELKEIPKVSQPFNEGLDVCTSCGKVLEHEDAYATFACPKCGAKTVTQLTFTSGSGLMPWAKMQLAEFN